jgi:ABC-type multidrug transport system fused ATPase/permease subunit
MGRGYFTVYLGLNKEVGEKGVQISGGQKQRIALSRCLVRNPSLYLFDEFTSALDADTEKIVFENLQQTLSGKTSLSIAHRLSTVEDCDHILVFKDGRIIESGNYSQLMALKNHFFSLAQGK